MSPRRNRAFGRPIDMPEITQVNDRRAVRLLMAAPLQRRGNRWRFGTATVKDEIIERLRQQGLVNVTADSATLRRPRERA